MMSAEEIGFEKSTFYFRFRGEINTIKVLELARERAMELKIKKMVVASETGRSALKALEVLRGTEIKLIVVTHYPAKTLAQRAIFLLGLRGQSMPTSSDTLKNAVLWLFKGHGHS
jgi:hypothetical protein